MSAEPYDPVEFSSLSLYRRILAETVKIANPTTVCWLLWNTPTWPVNYLCYLLLKPYGPFKVMMQCESGT